MRRVWVSGSEGKLGAEVCRQCAAAGWDVVGADVRGEPAVDLLDRDAVRASIAGAGALVHCAGIPSPEDVDPAELVRVNVLSTFHALEAGFATGARTAVLCSSGSIYGGAWSPEPMDPVALPIDESAPLRYVDPYALTKDLLERTGGMFARRGMAVAALRLHWVLTAEERDALAGRTTSEEDLRNLWGFVDLEDAARACVLALDRTPRSGALEPFVIASDRHRSDRPLADLLDEHLPHVPRRGDAAFDTARAARILGWRPTR